MTRTWITELERRGHEVLVATFTGDSSAELGAIRSPCPAAGRSRWLRLPFWVRRTVRDCRPDVVLALMTFPNLVVLLGTRFLRGRPPIVVSERNLPSKFLGRGKLAWRVQGFLARRTYSWAAGGVALSHPVAADMIGWLGMDPSAVTVVPNPVLRRSNAPDGRREPGVGLTVAFAGRLAEQKRVDRLVRAAHDLRRRGVPTRLRVFGEGPLRDDLERLARELGVEVEWRGWSDAWPLELGDASCLVLPSHVEGFGNVLVEAAHQGVPVVAFSSALGVADAVVPGVTGVLVFSDATEALADAIRQAAQIEVPTEALAGWWSHFSPRNSGGILERALAHVVGDGAAVARGVA